MGQSAWTWVSLGMEGPMSWSLVGWINPWGLQPVCVGWCLRRPTFEVPCWLLQPTHLHVSGEREWVAGPDFANHEAFVCFQRWTGPFTLSGQENSEILPCKGCSHLLWWWPQENSGTFVNPDANYAQVPLWCFCPPVVKCFSDHWAASKKHWQWCQ